MQATIINRKIGGGTANHDPVCYEVFCSEDYRKFKSLLGNRYIKESKVENIASNIQEVGWLRQPILVNENYEIIDGQHRFEALKSLGMPIEYVIDEGTTLNECQALNRFQSNWTIGDYVNSYADTGNIDYINFRNLYKSFPRIGFNSVLYSISEAAQSSRSVIMNKKLECSYEQFTIGYGYLEYLNSLIPYLEKVRGRLDYMCIAILFIQKHEPECRLDRLKKVIIDYHPNITPVGDVRAALIQFEKLYNYKCKTKFMNFANDYSEFTKKIGSGTKHTIKVHK